MHARQQIREAVATAITGLTSGAPVYQSRVYPAEKQALPALLVYTTSEDVDLDSMLLGDHRALRELTVRVECLSRLATGMDDQLDELCAEVETALTASIDDKATPGAVGPLVKLGELAATEIELSDQAENPTGRAVMDWQLVYRVSSADPTIIIP